MATLLLIFIYIAFISLGLPDSLFGSAWPAIYVELGVPLSYAGIVSVITACGTVASSLLTPFVKRKLGTGMLVAVSVSLTVAGMLAISVSPSFWIIALSAVPLGLGGGAIDSALNNFIAQHYRPIHMNLLHCFWGLGAFFSPFLMSVVIEGPVGWRGGYKYVVIIQAVIAALMFAALPLWKKVEKRFGEDSAESSQPRSLAQALKQRGLIFAMVCMFLYCGAEYLVGLWGSSYVVETLGLGESIGASAVSVYYLSIAAGRLISGLLSIKLTTNKIMRLGFATCAIGVLLWLLPLPEWGVYAAFALVGMGFGPVFPGIVQLSPSRYGQDYSQSCIGLEMASAYVGAVTIAPLFGLMLQNTKLNVFGPFVGVLLALMVLADLRAQKLAPFPQGQSEQQ